MSKPPKKPTIEDLKRRLLKNATMPAKPATSPAALRAQSDNSDTDGPDTLRDDVSLAKPTPPSAGDAKPGAKASKPSAGDAKSKAPAEPASGAAEGPAAADVKPTVKEAAITGPADTEPKSAPADAAANANDQEPVAGGDTLRSKVITPEEVAQIEAAAASGILAVPEPPAPVGPPRQPLRSTGKQPTVKTMFVSKESRKIASEVLEGGDTDAYMPASGVVGVVGANTGGMLDMAHDGDEEMGAPTVVSSLSALELSSIPKGPGGMADFSGSDEEDGATVVAPPQLLDVKLATKGPLPFAPGAGPKTRKVPSNSIMSVLASVSGSVVDPSDDRSASELTSQLAEEDLTVRNGETPPAVHDLPDPLFSGDAPPSGENVEDNAEDMDDEEPIDFALPKSKHTWIYAVAVVAIFIGLAAWFFTSGSEAETKDESADNSADKAEPGDQGTTSAETGTSDDENASGEESAETGTSDDENEQGDDSAEAGASADDEATASVDNGADDSEGFDFADDDEPTAALVAWTFTTQPPGAEVSSLGEVLCAPTPCVAKLPLATSPKQVKFALSGHNEKDLILVPSQDGTLEVDLAPASDAAAQVAIADAAEEALDGAEGDDEASSEEPDPPKAQEDKPKKTRRRSRHRRRRRASAPIDPFSAKSFD